MRTPVGERVAVTLMAIAFNTYLAKGHLEWIPDWLVVFVWFGAGLYWLSLNSYVRLAARKAFFTEGSVLVDPVTFESVLPRAIRTGSVVFLAITLFAFVALGVVGWRAIPFFKERTLPKPLAPRAPSFAFDKYRKTEEPPQMKPDLDFIIVSPTAPGLILWPLHSLARSVKADPLLWDIDREDRSADSLIVNEEKYDWIRTDQHGGPIALLDPRDIQSIVKPGHRIFGYITIGCPDCERVRICWVYFIYGQKGWFMDVSTRGGPNPQRIAESIAAMRVGDPEQFFASFPEWAKRIPILSNP